MSVIQGATSGNPAEVESLFKNLRVGVFPISNNGWYSIGAKSGAITTIAANGALFSLRNISANPIMVRRIGVGFITTTAFTTAQILDWSLFVARNFTASDSGGTAIAMTGNNAKHRSSLASPTSLDVRIAAAAALTAGTRTLDANALAQIATWSGGQGASLTPSPDNLFSHNTGDYPLILAQNEGLIITNNTLMGAAGVGNFFVNMEFAEVTSY